VCWWDGGGRGDASIRNLVVGLERRIVGSWSIS